MSEMLQNFHFLRPLWLLALPALWWLLWRWRSHWQGTPWRQVIDPELLPHLLGQQTGKQRQRWPLWLAGLGAALGVLALAGPSWQELPQPVYDTPAHRVLVMDLSAPMDAADLKPSRLKRARLIAQQLLSNQTEGDTALVVFAEDAFPVVPLTRDDATVRHLLDSLDTSLVPRQGQNLAAGIQQAASLLDNAQARHADIVLLTASPVDATAREAVNQARSAGYRLHVLAAGTPQGAPVPSDGGGWHKDSTGGIRLSRIDETALRELARRGGGRYARVDRITADWRLDTGSHLAGAEASEDDALRADLWRDEGPWLLLPLLPLAALAFRRGWLMLLVLTVPLGVSTPARADWWRNADQTGHALLQQGEAEAAAQTFRSRDWRASALYEAGDYESAAELWAEGDSAADAYNRGNALARAGQLQKALKAYDEALQRAPDMRDAEANRQLIEDLLQQQQEQQQQGENDEPSQDGEQQQEQGNQQGQDQQQGGQNQEQSGQPQSGDPQDPSDSSDSESGQTDQAQQDEAQQGEAEQQAEASEAEDGTTEEASAQQAGTEPMDEQAQAIQQWLNRVEDDPGRLLRNKFQRMQRRRANGGEDEQSW